MSDGTLNQQNQTTIKKNLPDAQIITKVQSDQIVFPLLEHYPNCLNLRKEFVLIKKYIDPFLLAEQGYPTLVLDSDILFYRPFKLPKLVSDSQVYFIKSKHSGYTLYPHNIYPLGKIRIKRQINSGMVYTKSNLIHLEDIEHYLSSDKYKLGLKRKKWYLEQTIFAMTHSLHSIPYLFDGEQIYNATDKMKLNKNKIVGIHFIGTYRYQFKHYKNLIFPKKEVELKGYKARSLNSFQLIIDSIKRKLN